MTDTPHADHAISSLPELQRLVPRLLREINADQSLAIRAAANPIIAMEELGYSFTPEMRVLAERRIRFTPDVVDRLTALGVEISETAGEPVDPDSPAQLSTLLFEKLGLPRSATAPDPTTRRAYHAAPSSVDDDEPTAYPPATPGRPMSDPLERLRGAHPVMEPLLEYRRIMASRPGLASAALYQRIKEGAVKVPATRIIGRLQQDGPPA